MLKRGERFDMQVVLRPFFDLPDHPWKLSGDSPPCLFGFVHWNPDFTALRLRRGERRRLMLANKAIAAYQQFRRQQSQHTALASA